LPAADSGPYPVRLMPDDIRFYRVADAYGCFSNFAPYPIEIDGQEWPTSERYFQAQKFLDSERRERIRRKPSPMIAARLGRDRKARLRPDWEQVKLHVMRKAGRAKFAQHEDIRRLLLNTGTATIVEHHQRPLLGRRLRRQRQELTRADLDGRARRDPRPTPKPLAPRFSTSTG